MLNHLISVVDIHYSMLNLFFLYLVGTNERVREGKNVGLHIVVYVL